MKNIFQFLIVVVGILFWSCSNNPVAQGGGVETTSGSVSGFVYDENGAALPNQKVFLEKRILKNQSEEVESSIQVVSNSLGYYQFDSVSPGDYILKAKDFSRTKYRYNEQVSVSMDSSVQQSVFLERTQTIVGRIFSKEGQTDKVQSVCILGIGCSAIQSDSTYRIENVVGSYYSISFLSQHSQNNLEIRYHSKQRELLYVKDILFQTSGVNVIDGRSEYEQVFEVYPVVYPQGEEPEWYQHKDFLQVEYRVDNNVITSVADSTEDSVASVPSIIIDGDFGHPSDISALINIYSLVKKEKLNLLGVGINGNKKWVLESVWALNKYYGVEGISMGYNAVQGVSEFNKRISDNFSFDTGSTEADSLVPFYRKLLSSAKDSSVTMLALFDLSNITKLIESPGDSISELSGNELMAKKVQNLLIVDKMAFLTTKFVQLTPAFPITFLDNGQASDLDLNESNLTTIATSSPLGFVYNETDQLNLGVNVLTFYLLEENRKFIQIEKGTYEKSGNSFLWNPDALGTQSKAVYSLSNSALRGAITDFVTAHVGF